MYLYIEMCDVVRQLGNGASMEVFYGESPDSSPRLIVREQDNNGHLEESRTLTMGQGLDLDWRQNAKCPSVEEYLVMIDNKTGGFFRLALRLMEAESPSPPPMSKLLHFITMLGRFYQIRDDYQNLVSDEVRSMRRDNTPHR